MNFGYFFFTFSIQITCLFGLQILPFVSNLVKNTLNTNIQKISRIEVEKQIQSNEEEKKIESMGKNVCQSQKRITCLRDGIDLAKAKGGNWSVTVNNSQCIYDTTTTQYTHIIYVSN